MEMKRLVLECSVGGRINRLGGCMKWSVGEKNSNTISRTLIVLDWMGDHIITVVENTS